MVCIDDKPSVVDEKRRIGDGEIKTVIDQNHQLVRVTIVEKKSKSMVMKHVEKKHVENKTSALVATATIKLLGPDKDRILTIAADGGKGFAQHEKVTKALKCDYYFARPDSCW